MEDFTIREGIRSGMALWLEKLSCSGDAVQQLEHKKKFLAKLAAAPICLAGPESLEQHYEVPTEFFRLVLGPRMKYSCNLHSGIETAGAGDAADDLAEAELRSLDTICQRAGIVDGMQVLDMGCGWGSLSLFLLERFPNCQVTAVSNSATQRLHIEERARQIPGGSQRLSVCTTDISDFQPGPNRFDRVVSIEMLEHMKNVGALFARVNDWLRPGGKLFSQILCHRQFAYNFDTRRNSDTEWMARNFFTGGSMFSADLFLHMQQHLRLEDLWLINGKHYSRTLEAWLRKLDALPRDAARRALMGPSFAAQEADEQIANWRKFFIFCSEVFGYENGNQWMVAHHLFAKRQGLSSAL
ncbi:hypothetical protein BOX15_Mlig016255g2 [Macrostomum lignano]|uniref:Uncharacterized protein n=1 Tax=Macrostomum lignano TaxID=282301 RepID=A0A267EXX4_9PLAT|nr:hypothetical protein BOX15_Mlig016255g2 [Macrostomum lignano]